MACNRGIDNSVRSATGSYSRRAARGNAFSFREGVTTKTVPLGPNPLGRWGLGAISSLRAVIDVRASTSVPRLDLAGKTHRRYCQYLCYRPLAVNWGV